MNWDVKGGRRGQLIQIMTGEWTGGEREGSTAGQRCKEPRSRSGLAAPRPMHHKIFRLASMPPGAPRAFQFLGDWCTPPGNEAFGPLCVSLYVTTVTKEACKLDRKLALDIIPLYPIMASKLHCIVTTTIVLILAIARKSLIKV